MNRPLLIAAFVSLLASLPLLGQRGGGGHASVGGHGGFASHGSFGGHMSGGGHTGSGHSFGGTHSGSSFAPHSFGRGSSFGHPSSFHRTFPGRGRNRSGVGLRTRNRDFRNNCRGFGCRDRFPWWDAGAFDPYWWWDSGSSYDQDQENQIGLANEMNQQSLDEQGMRQQDDQDFYARSAPAPRRQQEHPDPDPTTVLIFRDQHKKEVQNYAIVGQTLWSFAPQHTEKIPLAELDIPATQKANEDRGVDFRLPAAQEGQ